MTFASIQSVTLPAGVSLQTLSQSVPSHAARMAQMLGSMSWVPGHASRWWGVAPTDLCSAAVTIALVGPANLNQVMTVNRRWPRDRGPGEFRWQPSFSEPAYGFIEDFGASYGIAINGGGSTPDDVARNLAVGVAKSALWAVISPDPKSSVGFNIDRPGFNNVPLPPRLIERLLPDTDLQAIFCSVDVTLVTPVQAGVITVVGAADVDPSPDSEAPPTVADTVLIVDLVDEMQRSPFRVTQKPQLVASSIRIWLHTLGLIDADTVADLRTALASWPAGVDLQQAVIGRSERYGMSHRAPPEFKARDTTPERCDEIIREHPHRFAIMSAAQTHERAWRWSHWVRYLRSEHFACGPLPHFDWRHPD